MISCRWCGGTCELVFDLGEQAAADHFPLFTDPSPDPVHPLRMAMCSQCRLAQLAEDATAPDEPRGLEPAALREQAADAVARVAAAGLLPSGAHVTEFGSPHGGSWLDVLVARGLQPTVAGRQADVVVDVFGLMHEADQRAGLSKRVAALAPDGVLLVQFHSLAAIVAGGQWNALRHGHFAYYSSEVLLRMLAEVGLEPVGVWSFDLYQGTVLIAARARGTAGPMREVAELLEGERAVGVLKVRSVSALQDRCTSGADELHRFLQDERTAGRSVLGYGAASRTVALLAKAGVGVVELPAVADAAAAKQGRCLPRSRIPIIGLEELVRRRPDRVLLFVPDLLDEVRRALPELEASGGSWVVVEPSVRVIGGQRR